MAVLQSMREKFGIAISVIIALSLLYFIAPINDIMNLFGRPQNVGEINGKGVSYEDYLESVEKLNVINEMMTGSSAQNEQTQRQIRDAAWQEMLMNMMFIENAKAAGIRVGTAELVALTTGENASPIVSQNPAFVGEDGVFNPDAVKMFVQNLDEDETGRLRIYWNYLQNNVYNQRFVEKYNALLSYSNILNPLMLESEVENNNTSVNVEYVVANYPFQKDSTVTVSKSEVESYYKSHKDFFKQIESRDIEYVMFEVLPSQKDIAATNEDMVACYDEFLTTDNMKAFLLKNSDRAYADVWYKAGDLKTVNVQLDEQIFGGANETGIISSDDTFYAAKVMKSGNIPESVLVRHILLQGPRAALVADSLAYVIKSDKKADIDALTALYSQDKGSNAEGILGCIGWMKQNTTIPGFEAAFEANLNTPFVANTIYGTHVVIVTDRSELVAMKKVAILEKGAIASNETYNECYSRANKFAVLANGTYDGFKKAKDSLGIISHPVNHVVEGTSTFGQVDQAREVSRWIYDTKKVGKASEIITVDNNYFFVVALKAIHEEGYTPVSEVYASIENILYSKKLHKKVQEDVAKKIENMTDLNSIAQALESSVQTDESLTLAGTRGSDPAFLGALSVAEDGKIVGPVAGRTGVYVFKVNSRSRGSYYTEEDAKNMAMSQSQYASQMLLPIMMEAADVKDNRVKFF